MTSAALSTTAFSHPRDVHDASHSSAKQVAFVMVPASRYLMVDGTGEPGDPSFREAISTLYPVAYTLHFALRRRGIAAPVGALEGVYGVDAERAAGDGAAAYDLRTPPPDGTWHWRLLLPVPEAATAEDVQAAIDEVRRKGTAGALERLRMEPVPETAAAQVLHVGPYDAEAPTIGRLLEAIREAGLRPLGSHHEIYLSDPNRTAPARLKTLIRLHVEPA